MSTKLLKKFLIQQSEGSSQGPTNTAITTKSIVSRKRRQFSSHDDDANMNKRRKNSIGNAESSVANAERAKRLLQQKIGSVLTLDGTIYDQGSRASRLLMDERQEEINKVQNIRDQIRKQSDGIGIGNCRGNPKLQKMNKPNHKLTLTRHTKAILKKKEEAQQMKELVKRVQKDALRKQRQKNKTQHGRN